MPAPRAYSVETVIAVGAELEKTGPVTPKALHEALGGRGTRATPFATWETYVEARDGAASHKAPAEAHVYSQTVNGMITEILKLIVAIAAQVRRDTAEPFEMRADHLLEGVDRILAENATLRAALARPRDASIDGDPVEQAKPASDDAAPAPRSPRLILPSSTPRRPPRERLGRYSHRA
jgi:hypothetical protein